MQTSARDLSAEKRANARTFSFGRAPSSQAKPSGEKSTSHSAGSAR